MSVLNLRYVDGTRWRLLSDFAVETEVLGRIEVPAGFETDFASLPRLVEAVLDPEAYGAASVCHDFLYRSRRPMATSVIEVTRLEADQVFRELLIALGAPRWRVGLMYAGVRLGGWRVWRRRP